MKTLTEKTSYSQVETPVGYLLLVASVTHLVGLSFIDEKGERSDAFYEGKGWVSDSSHPIIKETAEQLRAFFKRKRTSFALPIGAKGTPFQVQVWHEIAQIPYGKTISYSELAERVGSPKAFRAVGLAAGQNPHCIVVPCHRVIGKNGSLTGFAGGLDRKRILLDHEGVTSSK